MKTHYAGAESMLQQMKGKLTVQNEKSSRLSKNLIDSFPLLQKRKFNRIYKMHFHIEIRNTT